MKKFFLFLAAGLMAAATISAQKAPLSEILPAKGDYAITVDAYPFLRYGGNMFNAMGNQAPIFLGVEGANPEYDAFGPWGNYNSGLLIMGKYFLEDNKAVRAKLRFDLYSETYKNSVTDANDATKFVEDKDAYFRTSIELGLGMEYRRGYGRLQGVYGYEASLGVESARDKYTYGNKMVSDNTTSTFWGNTNNTAAYRVTKQSYGTSFMLRPAVFAGVEYFFAKKMSIGGEFNLGLMIYTRGEGKLETEYWDGTAAKTDSQDFREADDLASRIGLQTSTYGALNLSLYF